MLTWLQDTIAKCEHLLAKLCFLENDINACLIVCHSLTEAILPYRYRTQHEQAAQDYKCYDVALWADGM